jgi:FAD:protein FMN transferase
LSGSVPPSPAHEAPSLLRVDDTFVGRFTAMASPCEVLIDTADPAEAESVLHEAREEALRVERKFSRYRTDNIVHVINHSAGKSVEVDAETAGMLDYAATLYEASGGLFDITSGILRRVWKFDGSDRVPSDAVVRAILPFVGWDKVTWDPPVITLPEGMEIDLGGIGKEYAVDRAAGLIAARTARPHLVNFGGDLFASGLRSGGRPWSVGIDDPEHTGEAALYRVEISRTGLATSGDARRFVTWKGKRLGHILNPRTGWPVEDAPRFVTVAAATCLEAGTLATLAYLQGPRAHEFLEEQGATHWVR